MEIHFSHRGLSSQRRWFTVAECGCTHKLLYSSPPAYCTYMYVSVFCDIISVSHPLYSLYSSWTFLCFAFLFSLMHLRTTCYWPTVCRNTVMHGSYSTSPVSVLCHHIPAFAHRSLWLQMGILLSLNHSCAWIRIIIPKDSFCPHSLIRCVTHSQVKSSTRENPLRFISSTDTPTCRGVTAGCPSSAFQPELMTLSVCVCAPRCVPWKAAEVNEDGWASLNPRLILLTNLLIACVALQKMI